MSEFERKRWIVLLNQSKSSIKRVERALARHEDFTTEDLEVRKKILVEAYAKYNESLTTLLALEEPLEEDDTEDCYISILSNIERQLKLLVRQEECKKPSSQGSQGMAKLPSLDIPTFDGKDISSYKPFIEMFRAVVHEDTRISDIQRLCFLKKYLQREPLHIIDSLPIVGESYEPAIKLLEKRYDNPALLINSHVTSLLDLQSLHRGTAQQLRDFVASVRQRVKALENLKQPVHEWNALLSCILLRKLDPFTVRLFHSNRDTTTVVTVDELLGFLDKRAASLEASPTVSEKTYKPVSKSVNLATVSKAGEKSTPQCSFCSRDHKLYKCSEFNALSPEKRNEFTTKNNLCKICLTYHGNKCRYDFKCNICRSSLHNTLIHVAADQPAPALQEGECGNPVSMHTVQLLSNCVLLPTAKVMVVGANNKEFVVKALLDCASQTSFCTTAFANQLELPQYNLQKNIGTLGDNYNNSSSKGIKLTIESTVHEFKTNFTCSIIQKITSKLPQKQINLSSFVIPKHVALADCDFHIPGEISLLLASDFFFRIIQDGKIKGGPTDPILLNTKLGYIVSSTSHASSTPAIAMHTVIQPDLDHCVRQVWEAEKIPDMYHESLSEHEYSEKVFQESVTLQNNTLEVKLPLKIDLQDDPTNSYTIALQRLYSLEKRFKNHHDYHDLYIKFAQEYLELGHAKLDTENCDPQNKSVVKIMGLSYDANTDDLQLNGRAVNQVETPTKRSVSSATSGLHDAMDFVGPIDWDTPLPNEFVKVLRSFHTIHSPRYIQIADADEVQLVGYLDATDRVYGYHFYNKVRMKATTHIHLLVPSPSWLESMGTLLLTMLKHLFSDLFLFNSLFIL